MLEFYSQIIDERHKFHPLHSKFKHFNHGLMYRKSVFEVSAIDEEERTNVQAKHQLN